jgi:glycosyltransferase involved in cell wall biosynthesis
MNVKNETIFICMSPFGNPISDYYNSLADEFIKVNYKIIFIFDGLREGSDYLSNDKEIAKGKNILFWPSKRPTKFSDFNFLFNLIKKERPIMCISNFGSTNVVSVISYLLGVKNRINYVHTTSTQLSIDSNNKWIKHLFLKYRKQLIYNLNTQLFTNSNGTKKDTSKFYNLLNNKIKVFPLLIKESEIKYKKKVEREYCVSIVGRLSPSKGHREILFLFEKCLLKFPDLKLKIIGDGYLKEELIELSKSLKINNNVIFAGKLPYSKIGDIFSNSLVNISSSIDEAYGLVNIEALREGTPLVCTKTAGSLDILLSKYNGIHISHQDENSLLNALTIIFNDWERYSKNAISTFEDSYSIENIDKHIQLIKNNYLT